MIATKPAKIFKSATRILEQSEEFRSLSTLITTYDSYNNVSIGAVMGIDDVTLSMGIRKHYQMKEDMLVVLMPLVGALEIEEVNSIGNQVLFPEEIKVLPIKRGQSYDVTNPSDKELVNFLQINLKATELSTVISFKNHESNTLSCVYKSNDFRLYFGVFNGRQESEYTVHRAQNGVFAFVINGAFEIEDRLVETRDGLALWEIKKVELEALSENAILLLLEVPYNTDTMI